MLAFETHGNGPATILLHGFLGNRTEWRPFLHLLPERRWILVDLPGHGESVRLPSPDAYSFPGVCQALDSLLTQLNIPSADIIGYSLGGRVAVELAATVPERVRSLFLESAGLGIGDERARAERLAHDQVLASRLRSEGLSAFLAKWYAQPLFATLRKSPRFSELLSCRASQDPEELACALDGLSQGRQRDRSAVLKDFPFAYLAGSEDSKYAALARELSQRHPESLVEICAEVGHNVHFEQPEVFRAALERHLRRQSGD